MKIGPIAILLLAAGNVPSIPDVTIKTKTTSAGRIVDTSVLRIQDARRRVDGLHSIVHIIQCDVRRSLLINDAKRIYASMPFPQPEPWSGPKGLRVAPDTRPITETIVIDAVDTGERRTFGPLSARRVVTTTTTSRTGESAATHTRVKDGWYLDLVPWTCDQGSAVGEAILIASTHGAPGRTEVEWKGRARTGWPVIETDRTLDGPSAFVVSTTLEEISEARLDPALFEIPDGYRPALPLGNGGFDLERPDTLVNRVRLAYENTASWLQYTWSSLVHRVYG